MIGKIFAITVILIILFAAYYYDVSSYFMFILYQ